MVKKKTCESRKTCKMQKWVQAVLPCLQVFVIYCFVHKSRNITSGYTTEMIGNIPIYVLKEKIVKEKKTWCRSIVF